MNDGLPEHVCETCGVISPLRQCTFCGSKFITEHEEDGFEPRWLPGM